MATFYLINKNNEQVATAEFTNVGMAYDWAQHLVQHYNEQLGLVRHIATISPLPDYLYQHEQARQTRGDR